MSKTAFSLFCHVLLISTVLASPAELQGRALFPTISVQSADTYRLAHACVQNAVYYVKDTLGCPYDSKSGGYLNACYCRADTQGNARGYLSSVIPKSCTVGAEADLSTALQIYDSYCSTAVANFNVPSVTGTGTHR